MTSSSPSPLWQQLGSRLYVADPERAAGHVGDLRESWTKARLDDEALSLLDRQAVTDFLAGVMTGSSYLTMVLLQNAGRAHRVLTSDPDAQLRRLIADLHGDLATGLIFKDCMVRLRAFKAEAALTIALADLGGVWPIMRVTEALAQTADAACEAAVAYLFRAAVAKGEWLVPDGCDGAASVHETSGYFVLGMGKHGAFELNYSSDIDLIVFYDPARAGGSLVQGAPAFFVKMTRDLVRLLNERTADGYVFRTDLRLRPDPGATQVAMSIDSALHYYESFGQNWERAAMIKARPVGGDVTAAERFLKELQPYVWRKYLDFAAIADIHAMKRQIHAHRGFAKVAVAGHNIKLGRGGIREIEFFAQTQQLIAGGRQTELRTRATLEALGCLAERGWITAEAAREMREAYAFLRTIEHRIQMVADAQTHQLPTDAGALLALAHFSGFETLEAFSQTLLLHLNKVQAHYSALFEHSPELSSATSNLVLAGEDDDPETMASLAEMGFSQPGQVLSTIRSWHRGRYAAVRSEGARARLTEVQPILVDALAKTINPDAALAGFDRFLASLPAGVQLFALLKAHPDLMRLVALIMGSAPRLAHILSSRRRVFDAVLDPRIIGVLPTGPEVRRLIEEEMGAERGLEGVLDRARIIGREQMFLIGVRLLTGMIEAGQAGPAYTLIAEELIRQLHDAVTADFEVQHGRIAGGAAAVVAMGRLGGQEMTATSDVDLIVIYDFDPNAKTSDGEKPLPVSQYYMRLTQRLISAISALTAEGRLYEVDMRLRPSGNKGPVATQFSSFEDYQIKTAWTWEHMALTRARVISGPVELRARIEAAIRRVIRSARDPAKLVADVRDMRDRIAADKGTQDIWNLKQVRGGLVDLEFIVQYLQLRHAHDVPEVLDTNTIGALNKIIAHGLIETAQGERLSAAAGLLDTLAQLMRICSDAGYDPAAAPDGLNALLAGALGEPDMTRVALRLQDAQAQVFDLYNQIVR